MINSSGQFVGAGVYMTGYGITAAAFNPYVGGVQYWGGTADVVVGSITLHFKGGAFISAG